MFDVYPLTCYDGATTVLRRPFVRPRSLTGNPMEDSPMSTNRTAKPIPHGTQNGYGNYRCRCAGCREAHRIWWNGWYSRRRSHPRPVSAKGVPPTAAMLRDRFTYDPETGIIETKQGRRAGTLGGNGYRFVSIGGKRYAEHRLAWLYVHGVWPTDQIDHINGDPSDNRLCNLREATPAQNSQNRHGPAKNNSSGFAGVAWKPKNKKWQAQIRVDGKTLWLGLHTTPEAAHNAYIAAKEAIHPFWAEGRTP